MDIVNIPIESLNLADYNPRTITKEVLGRLKKGLQKYGMVQPIVINRDNTVVGGHQRIAAAKELGWSTVPCVYVDLSKKDEKALNLALNKLSGDWQFDKLSSILAEFEADADFDLELTGFDTIEAMQFAGEADSTMTLDDFGGMEEENNAAQSEERGIVIQYVLIFDDETQQEAWHDYLRRLKSDYPECETHAERIIADIQARKA